MFKRLIVPLDGSRLAEAVLPAAMYLAANIGVEVVLLHLIEKNAPQSIHGDSHLTQPDEAMDYLKQLASQFPLDARVKTHVHEVQVSSVAASIVEHASELSSDLIALCTHGSGGLSEWLVGSIAQQVISMGSVPVLLISPSAQGLNREFSCQEILIPLDGKPEHEEGLHTARTIMDCGAMRLHLLQVVPTLGTLKGEEAATGLLMPGSTQRLLDMAEQEAREHLAEHLRELQAAGFKVTATVSRGDPVDRIVDFAKQISADIIVLGTHGKSGQNAFWEGSVGPKIPGRTEIPLLLVPVHS